MAPLPITPLPESGGGQVGSVGNIVSAALQTAGLYFQSDVLNNFMSLFQSFGVLLFVIFAIGGLTLFAIGGKPKEIALAFIGIPIFWFMLATRSPGSPIRLQVGERAQENQNIDQYEMLTTIGTPEFYDKQPYVSTFFVLTDRVVSSTVQALVSFLVDTKNKKDLVVVAREKALAELFSTRAVDQGLLGAVAVGMMGDCAELTRRNQELSNLQDRLVREQSRQGANLTPIQNNITGLKAKILDLEERRVPVAKNTIDYLSTFDLTITERTDLTCKHIWQLTWLAFQEVAKVKLDQATTDDEESRGIPWQVVRADLEQTITSGRPEQVSQILAAYIFRNTLGQGPHAGLIQTSLQQGSLSPRAFNVMFRRFILTEGEGALAVLQFFAGIVPYMQGTLLFILTAAFPFFCVFLLIPKNMGGFLMWVGLWIWVKSWDVGFAMLHVVREIMWRAMGTRMAPNSNGTLDDLTNVYAVINKFDPMVNLGTYNVIISLLTLAVPLVTAHLCLGANDLFGALRNGIDKTAQQLQFRRAHGARRAYASKLEQQIYSYEQAKGLAAAEKFAHSGEGRLPNGERLGAAGDGGYAQRIDGVFAENKAIAHYDPQGEENFSELAMFARRPVSFSFTSDISGAYLPSLIQKETQKYESDNANRMHNRGYTGDASPKAKAQGIGTSPLSKPGTTGSQGDPE